MTGPIPPLVTSIPFLAILALTGYISKRLAWFFGRYVTSAVAILLLIAIIVWGVNYFGLIAWPAWLVAAFCIFADINTLVQFDIDCYLNDKGIYAPSGGTPVF